MTKTLKLLAIALVMAAFLPILLSINDPSSEQEPQVAGAGLGTAETLLINYKNWEAQYVKNGGDRNLVVPMGWFKGLSTGFTSSRGQAKLNLIDGTVSVAIEGLPKAQNWEFWLIDNISGDGRTVMPEPGDVMLRVGALKHDGKVAKLEADLGADVLANFDLDLVVVTQAGKDPTEDRTLAGTTTLFHELYRSGKRGNFGVLSDAEPTAPKTEDHSLLSRLSEALSPTAHAQIGGFPPTDDGSTGGTVDDGGGGTITVPPATAEMINQGRTLFFNETFAGNGRTCGTCHRENNNLTIDPKFIATLPANDPLFVAEFTPALASNFENPTLMRKVGLILENVDGFDNLATKFTMRGVPHTLALLQNTLNPAAIDGSTVPPNERTGWSGDGAPGTGTLKEFAIGAVTQHFTKTLNRVAGVDFRLPTEAELLAMEAFQRSTGRRADLVLSGPGALSLKSEVAARGQELFVATGVFGQPAPGLGRCNLCHLNAGASFNGTDNANFNTGVETLPDQAADLVRPPQLNPPDGGFGRDPGAPGGGFGNGTFNTPVVVEAADTGPFFHNNAIDTIEAAVAFYDGDSFNNSPAGIAVGGIEIDGTQIRAIAAFLRVINSLESIRTAIDLETRARTLKFLSDTVSLLNLSIAELNDAIEVLDCGGLHPEAVQKLRRAVELDTQAKTTSSRATRNNLIDQALALKRAARADMVN
jgi:hypothetical protein